MSRFYAQVAPTLLVSTSTLGVGAVITGSLLSQGYTKLIGLAWSNASSTASGIRIQQSSNYGASWDYENLYTITASAASAFDVTIYGNAVKVSASMGATAASLFRATFALRPI